MVWGTGGICPSLGKHFCATVQKQNDKKQNDNYNFTYDL